MRFRPDNDHVKNPVYRLNDDLLGVIYVSDYGQFILSSYEGDKISEMEQWLLTTPLAGFLLQTVKYQFKESILYEFVRSDFEDFIDFLDYFSQKK